MTDTNEAAGETDGKRRRIALREWIDLEGVKVTDRTKAAGGRYIWLETEESLERLFGEPGKAETMCAIFGWMTKVGNIANAIVNADDYDGTSPMPNVKEWDADIDKGIWREAAEGVARGPKYDKDVLAGVLVAQLGANAKGDVAYYRERLDDKSYYAKVRANTGVMAAYFAALGSKAEAPKPDALA